MNNNSDIKLIACDLDGTLRPSEVNFIPEENMRAIEAAEKAGILFCPATGRTLRSTCGLIGTLPMESYCITENGGTVYAPGGKPVAARPFSCEMSMEICRHILSFPENELMMTGNDTTFLLPNAVSFAKFLSEEIYENVVFVDSPEDVDVSLVKISAFCPDSEVMFRLLSPGWMERCNVTIAGDTWVDFTVADKGTGVADLCEYLKISPENVMAVGDNYNDIPMLDAVGYPVLMQKAAAPLHERYHQTCSSVSEAIYSLLK